jgi:hypothetical protein
MPKASKRVIFNRPVPGLRSVAAFGLLALSASCVPLGSTGGQVASVSGVDILLAEAPPPAAPLVLQPVAPGTAAALNAAIPVVEGHNPAASPFAPRARANIDKMRSLDCLTTAIYYEAASESDDGQKAVAQVVLNRVRHPSYPNSVCGVVYQGSERTTGCQFSFTCDGSLARTPSVAGWLRARRIAAAALAGEVYAPVGLATHYHTYQVLPFWASSLVKSAVIGAHIFYRMGGAWGGPTAFRQRYAGVEPLPVPRLKADPSPSPSNARLQAELATLIDSGRRIEAQRLAMSAVAARLPGAAVPEVTGGPQLPESQVREEYRYSGMPRDQVPAQAR